MISNYTSDWRSRTKAQLLDDLHALIEMRDREIARREAAEAKVARVEALAESHDHLSGVTFMGSPFPPAVTLVDLRAALAPETPDAGQS